MSNAPLPVVAYEPAKHKSAFYTFLEKVLGAEKCRARRRVIDTFHTSMPGRERLPLRHVITDGDRIAGAMGHLPADFLIHGERVPARFTHDLLVDPDYRGRGLAKLIVDNAREVGGFLPGGMWMTDPCYRIHIASGFSPAHRLTTFTLVLDPATFVAKRELSAFKGALSKVGLGVVRGRAVKHAQDELRRSGDAITRLGAFADADDRTWQRLLATYEIGRVRDAAYLNWKYAHHPNLEYRLTRLESDGTARGFVIWRIPPENHGERRAIIVDYLVAKGDVGGLRLLLSEVVADAAKAQMEAVSVLTTQSWAIKVLRNIGFFPRGEKNTWAIGGWNGVIPEAWLNDHDPWHVCLGDSDGDIWTGSQ